MKYSELSAEAVEQLRRYKHEYYLAHKEQHNKNAIRYWERKAAAAAAEQNKQED